MIRVDRAHLTIFADSHPGMTGKNNEDRYAVSAFQLSEADSTPAVLAVLSDGIGGHRAGEVAAELAVEWISQRVAESDGQQPLETLRNAVVDASQQIYAHAQSNPEQQGMGGTCACAWVIGNRLYVTSVGDSRIYLLRGKNIRQLTTDHTWIQEALDQGLLKREEARGHPNAHVIRRFLGSPTPPQVDLRLRLSGDETDEQAEANQGLRLHPGDRILLCSDGLTDLVKPEEIHETLNKPADLEKAVLALIDLACARGGYDNITLVALEMPTHAAAALAPRKAPRRARLAWLAPGCLGLLVAGLLIGLALWSLGILRLPEIPGVPGVVNPGASPTASQTLTGEKTLPTLLFPTPTQRPAFGTPAPGFIEPGPTYTPWPTNTPEPLP